MKRAAQWWMVAQIAGLCLAAAVTVASAADLEVTDADRTYKNFTRESATVRQGEIRVEVRGLMEENNNDTRLDLLGFPVKGVTSLSGGIIDVVGSYGFTKNAEVGLIIPSYFQSLTLRSGGNKVNNSDIGDVTLYGKFQRPVADHFSAGAGMELSMPNGPVNKGFGTGELGVTPNLSTRYVYGRIGVGANVGWTLYKGDPPDVFNYGAEVIVRASPLFALRTEIAGRVFNQGGTRFDDLTVLPGIDYMLSENITIRPTGLVGGTGTAMDWGIGVGLAGSF